MEDDWELIASSLKTQYGYSIRKEINDMLRVHADGSGCYDAIVPKYKKLIATRGDKDYYVRGTFTKHNLDFAKDAVHMAELGFDQVSVEPVVSDPKLPYS